LPARPAGLRRAKSPNEPNRAARRFAPCKIETSRSTPPPFRRKSFRSKKTITIFEGLETAPGQSPRLVPPGGSKAPGILRRSSFLIRLCTGRVERGVSRTDWFSNTTPLGPDCRRDTRRAWYPGTGDADERAWPHGPNKPSPRPFFRKMRSLGRHCDVTTRVFLPFFHHRDGPEDAPPERRRGGLARCKTVGRGGCAIARVGSCTVQGDRRTGVGSVGWRGSLQNEPKTRPGHRGPIAGPAAPGAWEARVEDNPWHPVPVVIGEGSQLFSACS
jgi:hypothetical protein